MDKKFRCGECRNGLFEDKGRFYLGGIQFRAIECLECGNVSMLEIKQGAEGMILNGSKMICDKKEIISYNFN